MQRKITIAIFAICIVALIAILSSMLSFDFKPETSMEKFPIKQKIKKSNPILSWKDKLAKVKTKDHYFAVNNLLIQIDFKKQDIKPKRIPKEAYQLLVQNDRYSFFCVQKTLENFSLPFLIVKEKEKNYIIINSYDTDKIQKVVDTLKQYNINSKFKKVTI